MEYFLNIINKIPNKNASYNFLTNKRFKARKKYNKW